MLEAGEDRLYIARRLVRMAIEDIGLADPRAARTGRGRACRPCISWASPKATWRWLRLPFIFRWRPNRTPPIAPWVWSADDVQRTIAEPVPLHLRNAPTTRDEEWGYGEGYQHAHKFEDALPDMECLPQSLAGRHYYFPTERGVEKRIKERLEEIQKYKSAANKPQPE